MIYEQGDVICINFDPSLRHEPAGRHYAVVISPWAVNSRSSFAVVAPVTSVDNGYPFHVAIKPGNQIHGFVQCEAIRAMDLGIRDNSGSIELICSFDDPTMEEIMTCVAAVFGL